MKPETKTAARAGWTLTAGPFRTDIPARLDRLRWSRFHTLLIAALGTSWIIDGLEVTLVGSLAGVLTLANTLGLTSAQVGEAAGVYVAGAVTGAIVFGGLADRYGRRKLLFATLGLRAVATVASGSAPEFFAFAALRFLTGAGIGGEYAAINSAIQELMPARLRGRVDLAVNGSFWVGAAAGAAGAVVLLDSGLVSPAWGWRVAFIIGGALALGILPLRRFVPESPRWLLIRCRRDEAHDIVAGIEAHAAGHSREGVGTIMLDPAVRLGWFALFGVLLRGYPRRVVLALSLMSAQAFLYNAIFFTYAFVLTRYYAVPEARSDYSCCRSPRATFSDRCCLGPCSTASGGAPSNTVRAVASA